jgi:NTP pyrophosphatase (non-canonical NTP hydrolase)
MPLTNNLSEAEIERLALLGEECGEVQQAIGKVLRHGYESTHADYNFIKNRDLLRKEVLDLMAITRLMFDNDLEVATNKELNAIIDKKNQFLHHNTIQCV